MSPPRTYPFTAFEVNKYHWRTYACNQLWLETVSVMYHSKPEGNTTKRKYQEAWEEEFFFRAYGDNVMCIICSKILQGAFKNNVKRHYDSCHKDHHALTGKVPFS